MKRIADLKTVLLVEPIHRYRLFIEGALEDSEFELVSVKGPEEAFSILRGMTPHLLLVEDNLPGWDISRFLLKLRECGVECPFIIMSTQSSPENIRKYACLSIADFLVKPIDEDRLLKSLRVACDPGAVSENLLSRIQSRGLANVLVTDDIGASRRMMGSFLKKNGYTPIEAGGGAEAVNRVVSGGVDVLLLDYQMRDMNGLEVLQDLRLRGVSVPTIMVSAHATSEVVAKARVFGVVDFFRKPVDFPQLVGRINDIVGHGEGEVSKRQRILVIEDDSQMRNLVAKALSSLKVDILMAADGYEARTELQFSNVDIVILDMNLPGIDGLQLLREIEQSSKNPQVIIISGYVTGDEKKSLLRSPVIEVFTKPVDMNQLRKVVNHALRAVTV
ncbi:MAG: response regulator [Candidatus Omnitrophica bacterium]|nr:response regulator [Candidatus Omnitrophota bacterium]